MTEHEKAVKIKFYSSLALLVSVVSLYFYFLYEIRGVQNEGLAESITELREMESVQSNYSLYKKLLKDTETDRSKINYIIVNKNTTADFIRSLEMLAKHTGIEMTKTPSVEKATPASKDSFLRFNLRMKGEFSDIYYFLNLIENLPYKIRIKKISMSSVGDNFSGSLTTTPSMGKTPGTQKNLELWAGEAVLELMSYINE